MQKFISHVWVRGGIWALLALFFVLFIDRWPAAESWQMVFDMSSLSALIWLALAFVIATVLRTKRWMVLLRSTLKVKLYQSFAVFGWSFLLMTVTPFRTGELLRPAWVKKQTGSFLSGVGILVVERLADLTVLMGMLLYVAIVQVGLTVPWMRALGPLEVFLLIGLYFFITVFARPLRTWLQKISFDHALLRMADHTLEGLSQCAHPWISLKVMALTVAIWGLLALGYYAVLSSMFPDIHWSAAVLVLCAVNLTGIIWISPGNIGIYEAAAVLALSAYSIAPDMALIAAIGLHAVVLISTVVVGVAAKGMLVHQGGHWGDFV